MYSYSRTDVSREQCRKFSYFSFFFIVISILVCILLSLIVEFGSVDLDPIVMNTEVTKFLDDVTSSISLDLMKCFNNENTQI